MNKRTKSERLEIVISISKRLKNFPKINYLKTDNDIYMDLYNSDYIAIKKIKEIFKEYINQDDTKPELLSSMNGTIRFPELNRKIEYILPINKQREPVFVIRKN